MTAPLLDIDDAAQRLRVTPGWLAKAAARGEVPSRKVGRRRRFTETDLDDYLERVREGADPWARSSRSEAQLRRGRRAS